MADFERVQPVSKEISSSRNIREHIACHQSSQSTVASSSLADLACVFHWLNPSQTNFIFTLYVVLPAVMMFRDAMKRFKHKVISRLFVKLHVKWFSLVFCAGALIHIYYVTIVIIVWLIPYQWLSNRTDLVNWLRFGSWFLSKLNNFKTVSLVTEDLYLVDNLTD